MLLGYDHCVVTDRTTGEALGTYGVGRHETIYDALERASFPIRTTCRGHAICGLCVVRVDEGLEDLPPRACDERDLLVQVGATDPRDRLACRIRIPVDRERLVVALSPRA